MSCCAPREAQSVIIQPGMDAVDVRGLCTAQRPLKAASGRALGGFVHISTLVAQIVGRL